MSLKEVYEKVAKQDPTVGYVYDAPIHYIVINNGDGTVNMEMIAKFEQIFAEIEKSTGPGVIVTIGSGSKIFSQGFNL